MAVNVTDEGKKPLLHRFYIPGIGVLPSLMSMLINSNNLLPLYRGWGGVGGWNIAVTVTMVTLPVRHQWWHHMLQHGCQNLYKLAFVGQTFAHSTPIHEQTTIIGYVFVWHWQWMLPMLVYRTWQEKTSSEGEYLAFNTQNPIEFDDLISKYDVLCKWRKKLLLILIGYITTITVVFTSLF